MKKVLVIAGPTAVGKSDFAVSVAERFNLEVISGDSIQVYRGKRYDYLRGNGPLSESMSV